MLTYFKHKCTSEGVINWALYLASGYDEGGGSFCEMRWNPAVIGNTGIWSHDLVVYQLYNGNASKLYTCVELNIKVLTWIVQIMPHSIHVCGHNMCQKHIKINKCAFIYIKHLWTATNITNFLLPWLVTNIFTDILYITDSIQE